jgi:hypothetical protein
MILFACPDVDIAELEAKDYIEEMKLTPKDVRIFRRSGQVLVEALRDLD